MITVRKFGVIVAVVLALTLTVGTRSAAPASTSNTAAPASVPRVISWASLSTVYVLGYELCRDSPCHSALWRSTDAGKTFDRVPVPARTGKIVFANRLDGYALTEVVRDSQADYLAIYVTDDAGRAWRRLGSVPTGHILSDAASNRFFYAVVDSCRWKLDEGEQQFCSTYRLFVSPAGSASGTAAVIPLGSRSWGIGVGAFGKRVWLTANIGITGRTRLIVSTDEGSSFATLPAKQLGGIGCADPDPTSARVVWVWCITGLLADGLRSTNGGASFRVVKTAPNFAQWWPVTDRLVYFMEPATSAFLQSTNGGSTFTKRGHVPGMMYSGLSFAPPLIVLAAAAGQDKMYRSVNGGVSWTTVALSSG